MTKIGFESTPTWLIDTFKNLSIEISNSQLLIREFGIALLEQCSIC